MSSWWSSRPGSHGEGLNGRQCKLPLGAALALAEASYYFQVPFPCGEGLQLYQLIPQEKLRHLSHPPLPPFLLCSPPRHGQLSRD